MYFNNTFRNELTTIKLKSHKIAFQPRHDISINVVCMTGKASDQPAHTRSPIRAFANRLNIIGLLSY